MMENLDGIEFQQRRHHHDVLNFMLKSHQKEL